MLQCARLSVHQCPHVPSVPPPPVSLAALFPCAKCTQTFEFSEPSQVTGTQSEMEKEKEMEMETVTAISMRRGGACGSG